MEGNIEDSVSHREIINGCSIVRFLLLARRKGEFVDWRDNGFIRGWRVVATERRWLSLKRFWSTRFPVAIVAQRAIVNRDFKILFSPSLFLSFSLSIYISLSLCSSFPTSPFPSFLISLLLFYSYSCRIMIKLIESIQSWIFYKK